MTEIKENPTMCSNNNKSSTSTAAAVAAPTSTTMPTMTATALRGSVHHRLSRNMSVLLQNKRNTRAEFKRLKTILPSIRRKDNVSKLDIILEAIKYIDDLQDQLIDRLGGPRGDREATILALTAQASQNGDARLKDVEDDVFDDVFDHDGDADADDEDLISLNDGYMSDPGLLMLYQEDEDQDSDLDGDCSSGVSHASLEL